MRHAVILAFIVLYSQTALAQGAQNAPDQTATSAPEPLAEGTSVGYIDGKDVNGAVLPRLTFLEKNKIYLLDFWFIRCAPCVDALPKLVSLHNEFKSKGLVVIGVNSFDTMPSKNREFDLISFPKEKVIEVTKKHNITYPLYFTDRSIDKQFKTVAYPTLYLIQNGKIIYGHVGYSEDSAEQLRSIIAKKLAE